MNCNGNEDLIKTAFKVEEGIGLPSLLFYRPITYLILKATRLRASPLKIIIIRFILRILALCSLLMINENFFELINRIFYIISGIIIQKNDTLFLIFFGIFYNVNFILNCLCDSIMIYYNLRQVSNIILDFIIYEFGNVLTYLTIFYVFPNYRNYLIIFIIVIYLLRSSKTYPVISRRAKEKLSRMNLKIKIKGHEVRILYSSRDYFVISILLMVYSMYYHIYTEIILLVIIIYWALMSIIHLVRVITVGLSINQVKKPS